MLKRSLSFVLSDSQRTQKQGLSLLCSVLRVFQSAVDFKGLLSHFDQISSSSNILSKNDKKYFTFGIIHVNLIVMRQLTRLDRQTKDEQLACQSAILKICKGNALGLQILGGSVLASKQPIEGSLAAGLANIFQLLLENVQSIGLGSMDFFLALEEFLAEHGAGGAGFSAMKKSVRAKSAKIKQVQGMVSIFKELFLCEERHFSKGMTRRIIRGVAKLHRLRVQNCDGLVSILDRILRVFQGKIEDFWNFKVKKPNKSKATKKKQHFLSKNLKSFLHKVVAEVVAEMLRFPASKKQQALLRKLLGDQANAPILRSSLNNIFRTEARKGEKRSKVVLRILKAGQTDSAGFREYLTQMDQILEDAQDDQHMQNRKRECKNFIIEVLGDSVEWTKNKMANWVSQSEEAMAEGNWKKLKNGVEGGANVMFMVAYDDALKGEHDWLVQLTPRVLRSLPNFSEVLRDNSQQKIFKQICDLIFKKIKKIISKTKNPSETETEHFLRTSHLIRSYLESSQGIVERVEKSQTQDNLAEVVSSFLEPNLSRIRMNLSNCFELLASAESIDPKNAQKAFLVKELLLAFSLRNVFLDSKVLEPLVVETEEEADEGDQDIEIEREEPNDAQESDPFTSALRDLIRFASEFNNEKLGTDDFHILADCLCVLLSDPDHHVRSKILAVFEVFGENYDAEIVELVNGFLFEDLGQKVEAIESSGMGVKLEHLNIGEDIMIDSEFEDQDKEQIVEDLNLKKVKG